MYFEQKSNLKIKEETYSVSSSSAWGGIISERSVTNSYNASPTAILWGTSIILVVHSTRYGVSHPFAEPEYCSPHFS